MLADHAPNVMKDQAQFVVNGRIAFWVEIAYVVSSFIAIVVLAISF